MARGQNWVCAILSLPLFFSSPGVAQVKFEASAAAFSSSADVLASALLKHCTTAAQFCHTNIGSLYSLSQLTVNSESYTTTIEPTTYQFRTTSTSLTRTVSQVTTITYTVARHTKTIGACRPLASCGQITISNQASLVREACTSVASALSATTVIYKEYYQSRVPFTDNPFFYQQTTVGFTIYDYTVTTTEVPTKTEYSCVTVAPPSATCKNAGLQQAYFDLTHADIHRPPLQWNLSYYKTHDPVEDYITHELGDYFYAYSISRRSTLEKRSAQPYGCEIEYYNSRGYLYAPQTGIYEFSIPAAAQTAFIWIGDLAYSGYNVSNADIRALPRPGHATHGGPSIKVYLEAGKYYPLRSAWRCIHYDHITYWMNIRRPDGFVMLGEYLDYGNRYPKEIGNEPDEGANVEVVESDYIVRFGCGKDAADAPPYPPWGQET